MFGQVEISLGSPFGKHTDKGNGSLSGRCLTESLVFVLKGSIWGTDSSQTTFT